MPRKFILYITIAIFSMYSGASFSESIAIKDPHEVINEINDYLEHQQPDKAYDSIIKYINVTITPQTAVQLGALKAGLSQIVSTGPADAVDTIYQRQFGNSVFLSIIYLHFPVTFTKPYTNTFLKYTFMKQPDGWHMMNIDFKVQATFPPTGWDMP